MSKQRQGKHRTGKTVKRIRLRLHLERNLPAGIPPTEANLLLHYGVCP
jgi:hypothetical protein